LRACTVSALIAAAKASWQDERVEKRRKRRVRKVLDRRLRGEEKKMPSTK